MIAAVAVPVSGGSWLLARQVLGRNSRLAGQVAWGCGTPARCFEGRVHGASAVNGTIQGGEGARRLGWMVGRWRGLSWLRQSSGVPMALGSLCQSRAS